MKDFETLLRENYSRIYKYIFSMTGCVESSEDLIQEVFMVAYEKGETFLRHENPPGFLYKTARNLTLTYIKRKNKYSTEALDENFPSGDADLFSQLVREFDSKIDETAYTANVLGSLNQRQRELYQTRYVERRPVCEIAAENAVSEAAIRMRLLRLRREIFVAVSNLDL